MARSPRGSYVLKKGAWTTEEDEKLVSYIENNNGHGESWSTFPQRAGLNRCGKSCRLRWINYLNPNIRRGPFTKEEEDLIIKLHSDVGNQWSRIASCLPGRTDNDIKNHWNTHLRKRLVRAGVDPVTHKPTTDLNHLAANVPLSQLLSTPPNLGVLMNLMNISNALMLQGLNAIDFTNPYALQSFNQILNASNPSLSIPIMDQTMAFPNNNASNGLLGNTNDTLNGIVSQGLFPQLPNHADPNQEITFDEIESYSQEPFASLDGIINDGYYNDLNNNIITNETLNENRLPSMINMPPEALNFDQMENNTNLSSMTNYLFNNRDDMLPDDHIVQEHIEDWKNCLLT